MAATKPAIGDLVASHSIKASCSPIGCKALRKLLEQSRNGQRSSEANDGRLGIRKDAERYRQFM